MKNIHISPTEKQMWINGYLLALTQQLKKETKNPIARISAIKIMENVNINEEQFQNPLSEPLNHSLEVLLNEIKRGRPAETQLLIQSWIEQLNK
jgi:hypothetical protein